MLKVKNCYNCNSTEFVTHIESKDFSVTKEKFTVVTCDNCGLTFTSPRPKGSELGKYYLSEHYISHTNASKTLFEKTYQLIRKISMKRKYKLISSYASSGKILDIGCGTGDFLNMCKAKQWKTKGVEPNERARKQCIDRYKLDVSASVNLEEVEGRFDIITMWHVLEHVDKINETIINLQRLISENGRIIIAVPNINSYDCSFYNKYWAGYDLPIHLYHFTKESIVNIFKKHNLKLDSVKEMPFDSYYVSLLSEEHKTGKKNPIRALFIGAMSNIVGRFTQKGYSSRIYIFKKREANVLI